MDNETGKTITTLNHIKQSISEILKTPKGSRVMNLEFGSNLFELVDAPTTNATLAKIIAESINAITIWEKRVKVKEIIANYYNEQVHLIIDSVLIANNQELKMEVQL